MLPTNLDILLREIAQIAGTDHGSDSALQLSLHMESESSLLDAVRSLLPTLELTDDEVRVVALLYSGKQWFDIAQPTRSNVPRILTSLREKGIVEVEPFPQDLIEETLLPPIVCLNKDALCTADPSNNGADQSQPFASNREFLLTWFHHVKRLHKFHENERDQHPIHGLASEQSRIGDPKQTGSERKFADEERLLIQRSSLGWERFPLEVLVREARLDATERNILAFMLLNELENRHSKVEDVMTLISSDLLDGYQKDRYLKASSRLRIYELVSVDDSPRRGGFRPRTEVSMRPAVRHYLLTGEGTIAGLTDNDEDKRYSSAIENIDDWLRFITLRQKILRISDDDNRADGDEDRPAFERIPDAESTTHPLLQKMLERIRRKEDVSGEVFPLSWLIEEHQLSETERDILLTLLDAAMTGKQLDREDIARSLTQNPLERLEIVELLGEDSNLFQQDLVRPVVHRRSSSVLELDTRVRNYLLGYSETCAVSTEQLVVDDPILTLIKPKHTLDDLVLPDEIMDQLRDCVGLYRSGADSLLRKWGVLHSQPPSDNSEGRAGLIVMFHGISGTGKSLSGEAIAGTLECDILTTDISKILSVWVGESEANVSRLFDRYESIAQRMDAPPVLIIDECDQLLGKRFPNPERATDKMVNGMQSLLLERMGRFNGLMILTTNLVEDGAFDPAYNRRIHKKIRFPHPDVHARIALWRLHLRNVPLADDVDIERLARAEFTGGQIRIIIENASLTCVVRHKRERLTMGDLLQASRDEQENCITACAPVGRRSVGFCVEPELRAKEPVRSKG